MKTSIHTQDTGLDDLFNWLREVISYSLVSSSKECFSDFGKHICIPKVSAENEPDKVLRDFVLDYELSGEEFFLLYY